MDDGEFNVRSSPSESSSGYPSVLAAVFTPSGLSVDSPALSVPVDVSPVHLRVEHVAPPIHSAPLWAADLVVGLSLPPVRSLPAPSFGDPPHDFAAWKMAFRQQAMLMFDFHT